MIVVARFPSGGALTSISPPVVRFVGHGQVSVVLGRGALRGSEHWRPTLGASAMAVSRGPRVLVGRSVGNSPVWARSPVFDGSQSWAGLGHGRIQRAEGTSVSVGRYVCPGRRLGSLGPGENRARRESGLPDVTHRPLAPWPMALAIGQRTSWFAGLVYAIQIGTDDGTVGNG